MNPVGFQPKPFHGADLKPPDHDLVTFAQPHDVLKDHIIVIPVGEIGFTAQYDRDKREREQDEEHKNPYDQFHG